MTKIPTTYDKVQLHDMIDGETITQIDSEQDGDGNRVVRLGFGHKVTQWGPWTSGHQPVSVHR